MIQSSVRFLSFLLGLGGLRLGKYLALHHAPTIRLWPRWGVNRGLGFVSGILVSVACAVCFLFSASGTFPYAHFTLLPLPSSLRLVAEVALLDLLMYFSHRAYHLVPVFWRFHLVHHLDVDLDVSSASRFHPGEVAISALAKSNRQRGDLVLVFEKYH